MISLPSRRAVLALAVLALALTTGCVSKPVVTLQSATLTAASPYGIGMNVVLQITNPNSYDVQVRNVHAAVTVSRRYPLPPIDIQPNIWLPANQTTLVNVPVVVPWVIVPGLIAETLGAPVVTYHVSGVADVTGTRTFGIQKNDYPVEEDGTMPRQMFIDFSSRSIRF
jgi:LEA14-like dessication related protein